MLPFKIVPTCWNRVKVSIQMFSSLMLESMWESSREGGVSWADVLFLLSFSFPVSYLNYLFQIHFIFLTVLLIYFFHWSPWVYNIRFELIRVYLLLPELYIISFPTLFELLSHTLYFYLHHKHMSYCYSFWLEWVIF